MPVRSVSSLPFEEIFLDFESNAGLDVPISVRYEIKAGMAVSHGSRFRFALAFAGSVFSFRVSFNLVLLVIPSYVESMAKMDVPP